MCLTLLRCLNCSLCLCPCVFHQDSRMMHHSSSRRDTTYIPQHHTTTVQNTSPDVQLLAWAFIILCNRVFQAFPLYCDYKIEIGILFSGIRKRSTTEILHDDEDKPESEYGLTKRIKSLHFILNGLWIAHCVSVIEFFDRFFQLMHLVICTSYSPQALPSWSANPIGQSYWKWCF